jgi:putative NADH-flavin reductase
MKIALFGATGGTGKYLVKQSLERGFEVKALARSPSAITDNRVQVVKGDVTNPEDVDSTVRDCEAVLVALGINTIRKTDMMSKGVTNIVNAMNEYNITRLIVITSAGVNANNDKYFNVVYKWFFRPLILRNIYTDHERVEQFLKNSAKAEKIAWTIIQPPHITEDPLTKEVAMKVDELPIGSGVISYADLAYSMLEILEGNKYVKQAVNIETVHPVSKLDTKMLLNVVWQVILTMIIYLQTKLSWISK